MNLAPFVLVDLTGVERHRRAAWYELLVIDAVRISFEAFIVRVLDNVIDAFAQLSCMLLFYNSVEHRMGICLTTTTHLSRK